MKNIHTPERQPNETRAQYRERQRASKASVFAMTHAPRQAPAINALDTSRFFLGQHTNATRNAHRHAKRLLKRGDQGQRPKPVEPRKRKQYQHPLRDSDGAFTMTGRTYHFDGCERRIWLAGISAQRGY